MTVLTFGESSPIPNATVATTIRTIPLGLVNEVMIFFFVFGEEQAVNFSQIRNVCPDKVVAINTPELSNLSISNSNNVALSL